ncbi:Protein-glutamate methylesterase/protein-glutamine glutaminase [Methylorubrum aminovorans]|uniref:Blue-light-activated histidine kinase n=2 Tax=Methylorubrum aminovorans TaxID=269069 RepID=A0ABQ4UIL7_9HYPH|nr:chemotaxis protein CheB [Methylorubrum aminovorans]GJE67078.1 Protein-glutamate methylesterase/protein-glutamine glutaminase [Methylorubrum aminovorans]
MEPDFPETARAEAPEARSGASAAGAEARFAGPVVGIGASAGGLEALREMLSRAQAPTGMAFVVVQHLDPNYESMLAQLLDRHTDLEVLQCEGSERIEGDTVYIIPPGRGLAIQQGVLELTEFLQPRGLRRPIDDFFLSLAVDQQANAACVILSGTGADGTTGLRAVKEHGGVCVVQQPETARYDGMPLSAVGTGLVDFVQPPGEIVNCLAAFFRRRGSDPLDEQAERLADHVDDLCRVIRTAVGHDFSGYKRTTLIRRVERRMHVLGIDAGRDYLARIRADKSECDALFRDLLINVTRFFRDAEMFEVLRERAIEPLLRDRDPDEDIRVWIPGCSSGEEAYSIAMLFADAARRLDLPLAVQIFATDIDERMLQIAREATYPAAALADIPAPLRERYVVPHAERFTIASEIRDLIRFSSHSLVKDPPFSRIDLLSCRNLLIYFDDRLQQSVLPLFHYAVRPGGYLFLGPSESVSRFEQLFPPIDQHARLFERPPGSPKYPIDLPGHARRSEARRNPNDGQKAAPIADETAAARRMLERYAPPSMVLNEDGAIIAAYGRLSRYFDFPVTRTGGTSAITLARPGLRDVIGPLLRQTRDARKRVVVRDVEVVSEYGVQQIELVCDPLPDATMLLVLRDAGAFRPSSDPDLVEMDAGGDHVEALEEELLRIRYKLRSTVEELETANEELKSSNEEMMSMNEELQSTNEELTTVNDELKTKIDQLTVANADLRNFFESTDLAVVVLDRDLRVRSFTGSATAIFPLQPSDRGRPLADVATRLAGPEYLADARAVCAGGSAIQRRVVTRDGERTLSLRVLPYRLQSASVDGATLVLTDITEALSLERELAAERERLDLAIKAGGIGIWEYLPDDNTIMVDATAAAMLDLASEGRHPLADLEARLRREDRREVRDAFAQAARGLCDFEARLHVRGDGHATRYVRSYGRLIVGSAPHRIIGVSIDVSPEHALTETRDLMLREMNHRVKNLFAIIGGMITAGARLQQDVATFAHDMRDRIAALGRAHSLADHTTDQGMSDLCSLVGATLQPYRDHIPIAIEGPPTAVDWRYVSSLAMILHECATNSVKYGALGAEDGRLEVTWEHRSDGLAMQWTERMTRRTAVSAGRGFGTSLIEMSLQQLQATVERKLDESGYQLTLVIPSLV